jgi:hypothetical protein
MKSQRMYEWALLLLPLTMACVCALGVVACTSGLSATTVKDLTTARTGAGMAYQHVGADSAPGAEMRLVYCAVDKAMRDNKVDAGADDAGIVCKRGQ